MYLQIPVAEEFQKGLTILVAGRVEPIEPLFDVRD